jgi:hypothetical protein
MTTDMPSTPNEHDAIDRAIDDTLQTMVSTETLEGPSRARLLARLARAERDGSTGVATISRTPLRRLAPWAAATAVASIAIIIAVLSIDRQPTGRPGASASSSVSAPAAAPSTEPLRQTPRATSTTATTAPTTPTRHAAARSGGRRHEPPRATPPAEDRLAYVVRAFQQLPTDVWERLDSTAPPEAPVLSPAGPPSLAPLAVEQLPGSDLTVSPSTVTSPGASR